MSDLQYIQDNLLNASAKELLRADSLHLTIEERNKYTDYEMNFYVLIHYHTGSSPTYLHTNWKGSMKVIKGFNSRYTLLNPITGKETDFQFSDMKLFVFNSAVVDPLDIARRVYMKYFVDKILQHCGSPKESSSVEFEVNWHHLRPLYRVTTNVVV